MKLALSIIAILLAAITLSAQPSTITYQGKLLDASGNPVTNPAMPMTFAIYDASGGGTKIWPASGASSKTVDVQSGMYTVILGAGVDPNDDPFTSAHFAGNHAYLEVIVNGTTLPRTQLMTVPYSFRSALSESLSASAWASPGAIGTTSPNTGSFTNVSASSASFANLTMTAGAGTGKVMTSNASGEGNWQFPGPGFSYEHVINVAKSGGDYTAINDALAAVGAHDESNRWLIKVHPGTYTEKIKMLEYVDIEGSGQDISVIISDGGEGEDFEDLYDSPEDLEDIATVVTVNNAEIRNLTVISDGGFENEFAVAMANASGLSGSLFGAQFGAQFGDLFGDQFGNGPDGLFAGFGLASVHHVTIIATGGLFNIGFFNIGEAPYALLNHVKIYTIPPEFEEEMGIGIFQMGDFASMVVRNSYIWGLPFSVLHCGEDFGGYPCEEGCFCRLIGTSTRFIGFLEFCHDEGDLLDWIRLIGCSQTEFLDDFYLDALLDTYGNPGNPGDVLTIIPDPDSPLELGIAVWGSPFIKGSTYINIPQLLDGGASTQTFSVSDAETGSTVSISPSSSLGGLVIAEAWVSSSGTVSVTFVNPTGSTISALGRTFYYTVSPPEWGGP